MCRFCFYDVTAFFLLIKIIEAQGVEGAAILQMEFIILVELIKISNAFFDGELVYKHMPAQVEISFFSNTNLFAGYGFLHFALVIYGFDGKTNIIDSGFIIFVSIRGFVGCVPVAKIPMPCNYISVRLIIENILERIARYTVGCDRKQGEPFLSSAPLPLSVREGQGNEKKEYVQKKSFHNAKTKSVYISLLHK